MAESRPEEQATINPNGEIAAELLLQPAAGSETDLREIYAAQEAPVDDVELHTYRPGVNVLHMSELLLGHADSAVDFYEDTIDQIASLPEDMRPDAVVLSGLLQGDFRFLQKPRRPTLVPELSNMDAQFKYGRQMLEKAQGLGVPVVYNLSNDDHRIAEENTVEVFRNMHKYAKTQTQEGVNWAKVDKMRQHPQWSTHLKFQTDEVLPYCLRAGRSLYTVEEMAEKTGGKIDVDEYFVLFGADQAVKNGSKTPPAHTKWLKQVKRSQNNDVIITNDVNLHITTEGRTYTDWIRHYMGFSPQSMYQSHMRTPMKALSTLAANGEKTPDMFVTQHNQEEVGVGGQSSWIISTGGLIRARNFLNANGTRTGAAGDVSRRLVTTRRRIPEPSASMHERTDDGRHIVTFFNEVLNEKSHSLPERTTIAELCDLQTGSISARPDILAKYLDYIRTRALGERATAMFFGGDLIHGRNYPHFASESQMTGLIAMDSQEAFNTALFQQSFDGVSADELKSLQRVLVQPGNHEWNSGTYKWHGYSFTTYMRNLFERMYARAGFSDEEIAARVKSHEATVTAKGDYATGYGGVEYFGDMGVLIKHFMLERGAKGGGGDLPVYQTEQVANGSGSLMRKLDIFMAGHWHHPQYALLGNKLGVVGGSMAGLSGYELDRGYNPVIAGTLLHIGGGLPPQVEFVSDRALHAHKVSTGGFAESVLRSEGFKDDRNFDPLRHGIFLPDNYPKSALQKKILKLARAASQRAASIAELK